MVVGGEVCLARGSPVRAVNQDVSFPRGMIFDSSLLFLRDTTCPVEALCIYFELLRMVLVYERNYHHSTCSNFQDFKIAGYDAALSTPTSNIFRFVFWTEGTGQYPHPSCSFACLDRPVPSQKEAHGHVVARYWQLSCYRKCLSQKCIESTYLSVKLRPRT